MTRVNIGLGLLALSAYALLKAAWGMGSEIGIADQAEVDRVFGSLTGTQFWLATWGTVVLAGLGALLLLLVAANERTLFGRPPVRVLVRGFAWFIAVALGAYAVLALGDTVISEGPSPFTPWVSYLTYGSFLVYALALGWALISSRRARPTG